MNDNQQRLPMLALLTVAGLLILTALGNAWAMLIISAVALVGVVAVRRGGHGMARLATAAMAAMIAAVLVMALEQWN